MATLLATVAGYLKLGNDFIAGRLKEIAAAEAELDAELATAANTERELAAEAAALEVTLAETTPNRLLTEFISDRLGSDDYRKRLGVPALVRRDLARISTLIQQRHSAQQRAADPTGEHGIDRIVLYIDDLDRCPTKLVVDVLQAVHLLLAFPLFVVVVAVDARWLSHSLREHYHQLQGTDAAPEDFIEKIFQVPFWVRPLDPMVRYRMITGLMSSNLAAGDTTATNTATSATPTKSAEPDIAESDLPELRSLVASFADTDDDSLWLEAAALPITRQEFGWMQQTAPLLGDTPRAVKRFTNIYLLVRSVGRGHGWPPPTGGQVVVLLAIATGMPRLAAVMLPRIECETSQPFPLHKAIPDTPSDTSDWADQHKTFKQWLDQDADVASLDVSGLAGWIDVIRRFRFHR